MWSTMALHQTFFASKMHSSGAYHSAVESGGGSSCAVRWHLAHLDGGRTLPSDLHEHSLQHLGRRVSQGVQNDNNTKCYRHALLRQDALTYKVLNYWHSAHQQDLPAAPTILTTTPRTQHIPILTIQPPQVEGRQRARADVTDSAGTSAKKIQQIYTRSMAVRAKADENSVLSLQPRCTVTFSDCHSQVSSSVTRNLPGTDTHG